MVSIPTRAREISRIRVYLHSATINITALNQSDCKNVSKFPFVRQYILQQIHSILKCSGLQARSTNNQWHSFTIGSGWSWWIGVGWGSEEIYFESRNTIRLMLEYLYMCAPHPRANNLALRPHVLNESDSLLDYLVVCKPTLVFLVNCNTPYLQAIVYQLDKCRSSRG